MLCGLTSNLRARLSINAAPMASGASRAASTAAPSNT
ncbi:putative kR domain protein [Burkholderia mallei]|nr:putative kR domain protein [Burkholderia mallei]